MSRKRPHLEEDSQNNVYLLPGCYTTCSCSQEEEEAIEYYNLFEPFLTEEYGYNSVGNGLYIADAYGNIFYTSYVSYLCCEDIVCCAEAQMETDDISDPEAERESKKTRFEMLSDDDEETSACERKKGFSSYIVEEPPDEGDGQPKTSK